MRDPETRAAGSVQTNDSDRRSIFLLDGAVELRAGSQVLATITSGSDQARHSLAPHIPRSVTARAASLIEYFEIDSDFLDILLTWDQSGVFEVAEIRAEETPQQDWMAAVLQVRAFHQIPAANIQALFMRMQQVNARQGEVIVRQGDVGDYFYVLTAGQCVVAREAPNSGKLMPLAELSAGASFGEEALLAEATRNATVTMLTDGTLVRLAKEDFKSLLIEPQQRRVALDEGRQIVAPAASGWT